MMGWAIEYGVINFACHVDVFNDFLCPNTIVNHVEQIKRT